MSSLSGLENMQAQSFNLKFSICLLVFMMVTHVFAMGVILILNWPLLAKSGGIAFIALSLWYGVWKMWGSHRIVMLHHQEARSWRLETAKGQSCFVELQSTSFVSPWLINLNFVSKKSKKRILITLFPDALCASQFRQLCVISRFTSFH